MTDDQIVQMASEAVGRGEYQQAMGLLSSLADGNSGYALTTIGWMHECGHLGVIDKSLARQFYERATAIGGADGYLQMGWLLMTEDKLAEARAVLEKGAAMGNKECTNELIILACKETENLAYEAMQKEDYQEAMRLLIPLTDRESVYALATIGDLHENGNLGTVDKMLARQFYERAIAIGSAYGCLQLGRLLMSESKFAEARAMLEKGAEIGCEDCTEALSILACNEVQNLAFEAMQTEDYQKVFTLLEPHKTCDSEYILITLGWLYHTGRAGVTDKHLAGSFYRRAAEIGCIDAHYRIGILEKGEGNNEAARMAFCDGAMIEHLPAMSKLGEMMIEGKGGPVDIDQGMKLLLKAAEQGHIMSKLRLNTIAARQTNNIFKKTRLKLQRLRLGKDWLKELLTD